MGNKHYCEHKEPPVMYRIGLFSSMNRITIKALRHYDEIGLFKPGYIDQENGYRYYTSEQRPIIHKILALRDMGFSLEEIKSVMNGMSEKELLLKKKSELLRNIADDTRKLAEVEGYLSGSKQSNEYPVLLKKLPEAIIASRRKIIKDYEELFTLAPSMGAEMERLGCECSVPDYCFTMYHDDEYKEEDIDVELCEAVIEAKENSDLITFKKIEAVPNAACVYQKGPYNGFPNSYAAAIEWIEQNGYEINGHIREVYIDGVWNKDNEEDWLSEIQIPVKKLITN